MLHTLQGQPEPVTLTVLTAASGLHANTVREHLEALVRAGLVQRHRAQPSGRGRPAWLYEAIEPASGLEGSEYAGLAATLASFISRTSDSPRQDAVVAGTEWGHDLARARSATGTSSDEAGRRRVVELLEDIGFAPTTDDRHSVVRLTRCPLLEAAHKYPDVVCGVHLGIVRGALAEYGADSSGTDLVPFAEPGACRLELLAGASTGQR